MKKIIFLCLLLFFLLGTAGTGFANTIFYDDFNREHHGTAYLNYSGFGNWGVSDGTFDHIGNSSWQLNQDPSYRQFVEIDGSTHDAGNITGDSLDLSAGNFSLDSDKTVNIVFEGVGGDNIGMLLDNGKLKSLPENAPPATMLLLGSSMISLAGFRREFRKSI